MNTKIYNNAPLISDVIKALKSLKKEYGDLPVIYQDNDTEWELPFGLVYRAKEKIYNYEGPDRISITSDYYPISEIEGLVERRFN